MSTPTEAQPWTTDHTLHLLTQVESRPAASDHQGQRWLERRATGRVLAVCNCGYSSGWITRDQLPSSAWLLGRHGVPETSGV